MATLVMDPSPRIGEVVAALRRHLQADVTVTFTEFGARTRILVAADPTELVNAACLYLDPLHIAWDVPAAA